MKKKDRYWAVFSPTGAMFTSTIRKREGDCKPAFFKNYIMRRHEYDSCSTREVLITEIKK